MRFLARRWFLLLIAAGLCLVLVAPGQIRPLVERVSPRLVVAGALFLTAWAMHSRSLLQALLRPWPALAALAVGYGIVPLLALLLRPLLPGDDLPVGLLLTACLPCTLASAVIWTRLAGGREATALLIVLFSTGTGWLCTPGLLRMLEGTTAAPPVRTMMADLALVLILPVSLGQLCRALPPVARAVDRHRVLNGVLSRLLIFVIFLRAAAELPGQMNRLSVAALLLALAACAAVHLGGLTAGLYGSRALGCERADAIAVALAGSQKSLPVGLYLFQQYFAASYPLASLPLVFYHVLQLVLDTFVAESLAERAPRGDATLTQKNDTHEPS